MPTPRPENSVTSVLVENPAFIISSRHSRRVYSCSGFSSIPLLRAFSSSFFGSMPAPLSRTSISASFDSYRALSVTVGCSALPAAARSSGLSIPWSTAFRTRCISGSPSRSAADLSTSVSSPSITSVTFLPSFLFISRTTRFIFENTVFTGTIRTDITTSCNSSVSFFSSRADL